MTKAWSFISRIGIGAVVGLGAVGTFANFSAKKAEALTSPTVSDARAPVYRTREPIQPLEPAAALDATGRARLRIGGRLFADPRLSQDDSLSCAGCHDLAHGGVDGRARAVGIKGRVGLVNTPTVFNADVNVKQFWDGRADSLEAQIDGPLQNPDEMGMTWEDLLRKLRADAAYRAAFDVAYPSSGITAVNVRDALATFERTLITADSRFDRFLRGAPDAINAEEKLGYERFKSYGCISCHQGRNVGGNVFEKLGIMEDYFAERGGPLTVADQGRFNVTRREEDRFKFRVPSLRMASLTAPYFHDGHAATLEEAVVLMGRYQLGQAIPADEARSMVAFIGTLAGTYEPEAPHATR